MLEVKGLVPALCFFLAKLSPFLAETLHLLSKPRFSHWSNDGVSLLGFL